MDFPLDVVTELSIDGSWVDVSADTRHADGVQITRGRSDEANAAEPSHCEVTLDNRSGKYSARNPSSPYYGLIGRNTPMRVRVPSSEPCYLLMTGCQESHAYTADHSSLDIVNDLDVRVDLEPHTWRPVSAGGYGLAQKYRNSASLAASSGVEFSRSWVLWLTATGHLSFRWSPDGTTLLTAESTVAVPDTPGRMAVRVALDVNNGSGGKTVTFYTASTIVGPWGVLGSPVTTTGTTTIFSGTADLEVGRASYDETTDRYLQGRVYRFQVRNNAGFLVTSPDWTAQDSFDHWHVDGQGREWNYPNAVVVNPSARFHGEVSVWPPKWDKTGRDKYTPIQGYGILHRLSQGQPPLRSVLYRVLSALPSAVAYWPCEDGEDATNLASAIPGGPPMTFLGDIETASFSDFKASDPLPTASGKQWVGTVPRYTSTGYTQLRWLMHIPAEGVGGGVGVWTEVARIRSFGTAPLWKVSVSDAGSWRVQAYDSEDAQIMDSGGLLTYTANGKLLRVSLSLDHSGATVKWNLTMLEVGQSEGLDASGTLGSRTVGRVQRVALNTGGTMQDVAMGHVVLQNEITSIFDLANEMTAYAGETATQRVVRICREEGLPVEIVGDVHQSTRLGAQTSATLLELLREVETADMGVLYEPRGFFGLAYRTRDSLYAQDATLTLDYSAGTINDIEPVEDDQGSVNDITVTRIDGSSQRAELTEGPLSVLPPPDGIGRYDNEVQISVERDADLSQQAAWRLHMGTVDEARYPTIGILLESEPFRDSSVLAQSAVAVDVGDRLVITNPEEGIGPPEDIQQIAQGYVEVLTRFGWSITYNCSPGSVWDVAVWDDSAGPGEARYSTSGTYLEADVNSAATSLAVDTPKGPVWGTVDLPYDLMLGGERVRVTAVSGTGRAQNLTVQRGINGILKSHAMGTEVRLFQPAVYAL
jgi:hypothetical protein